MPSHEEHCKDSLKKYRKPFSELHHWMDEPSTLLGKGHRIHRHDPLKTPPVAKELFGHFADEACLDHIRLDELESRRTSGRQIMELTNQTDWFLDFLFPHLEIRQEDSWDIPKIRFVSVPIYYDPADSYNTRTNVLDSLVEYAVDRYGVENVNARLVADGNIRRAQRCLDKKPVQAIFVDRFTEFSDQHKLEPDVARTYLELPRILAERAGEKPGLIVVFLGSHSFKMPPEVMHNCCAIIFRNSPATHRDYDEVDYLLGEDAIVYLKKLEQDRKENNDLLKLSVFWTKNKTGILETSIARNKFWKEPMSLLSLEAELRKRTRR
ncbi:hypothetical protein MUP77_08140 [Candidatus Bathyarchaeota archaeon]|nr:hypothetical protein [Candidatus Bathyarchaeota archaeon]